jgi:TetR/AcrR family transcriptional repressor of nem operon
MYDTFGDKRHLYLEAFRRYVADSINEQIGYLEKSSSPLAGIEKMLLAFATRTERDGMVGCMGVNAICEFGRSDPEVTSLGDTESIRLTAALEQALRQAKSKVGVGIMVAHNPSTDPDKRVSRIRLLPQVMTRRRRRG